MPASSQCELRKLAPALGDGIHRLGLTAAAGTIDQLLVFVHELQRWNAAYNLTAVREPSEMISRHLLDSLAIAPHVRGALVDVGSGAGLPGLPLAILEPARAVVLLEPTGKRARFLNHVIRSLALGNVQVAQLRVEDWAPETGRAGSIVCRAFARLGKFLQSSAHLGNTETRWLAMKGKLDASELDDIPENFRIMDTVNLQIPELNESRHLIIVARRAEGAQA